MQLSALYVQVSLFRREQQRRRNRNNPSIGYSASTTHHQDNREMPAVSRSLEKDCRPLAHQGPDPWNTTRLDRRSASVQQTLRLSKKFDWHPKQIGSLPKDPPALSRHRISLSTPRSVQHGRSVVSLLPRSEEGRRQDKRLHRSQHDQPYLQYEHFKMEGLHTIQAQLRRRDHM